jgi:hypothetical protein
MKTIGCVQHDCPECKAREAKPPLSAERAALIRLLKQGASISRDRNINLDFAKVAEQAADMLAADAQELEHTRQMYEKAVQGRSDFRQALREARAAKQVAVPPMLPSSYTTATFVSDTAGYAKVTLHFSDEKEAVQWFDTRIVAAVPQPPQAERVPITDVELARITRLAASYASLGGIATTKPLTIARLVD